MKITKEVYEQIMSLPETNTESAYLLGSSTQGVIDVLGNTKSSNGIGSKTSFAPNVNAWNQQIESWSQSEIEFIGILHTHYYGVGELSVADIEYINAITFAVADEHIKLYFPVFVFPERKLVLYSAGIKLGRLIINEEDYMIRG